jgi:hypothetical protein
MREIASICRSKKHSSSCCVDSSISPGARAFRRHLAENGVRPGAGVDVLRDAIALVEDRVAAPIAA